MYRTLFGLVGAVLGATLLGFCSFGVTAERAADFVFVNGTEPKSLDPHIMTGQPEGRIADAIFEGLTYRDPRTMVPTPGLAESWTVSPDQLVYRFRIRKDARWSDGRPITARDVADSWRRLQEPSLGSEYAYILHMVRGAREYNTHGSAARSLREKILPALDAWIAGPPEGVPAATWTRFVVAEHLTSTLTGCDDQELIDRIVRTRHEPVAVDELRRIADGLRREAETRETGFRHADAHFGVDEGVYVDPDDPSTLVVELVAPTPYFLELTSFYSSFPVPMHVVREHPDDWFLPQHIVGNGPYVLTDWHVNLRIRLEKSPTYWNRDAIALETIDALPIEESTAAMNRFLNAEVDWAPGPPLDLVPVFRDRPEFRSAPAMMVYFYRLNCEHPALKDPRVRRAIGLAIDRRAIVDKVLRGGQEPALRIVPPGLMGYDPPESDLGFDVERARAELASAGYPNGRGIGTLRLVYNTMESHKLIAEAVSDQLRRHLGLDVKPLNKEWQTYQADVLARDYDMARAGWIGDYLDPNTFLDMWVTNGGQNQTGWSDPRYDRLIRHASDVYGALAGIDEWIGELLEPERGRELVAAVRAAGDAEARWDAAQSLRKHLLREAEALLFREGFPIIPIYFYVTQSLVQPWVEGWYGELERPDGSRVPNLQDIHPLRGIRVTGGPRKR